MSDSTVHQTRLSEEDEQRVNDFQESNDLNDSQAIRRLVDRGLQYHSGWAMVRDIAVAATLWAAAAALGAVLFDLIPNTLAMFSVAFAGVLLTAYGAYELRWRLRDRRGDTS